MRLDENTCMHGFRAERIRRSEELGATLVEMTHMRTRARLCWLDNKEDNKLFSIAFKTLPEDDTGVFHILEHSTLCGSEKYPVKEPFVELLKGSMKTFLNAMTFPDKTLYPVSSRNAQDYLNLMSVYLDAVFAPRFLRNPNIFYQEGWHIEVNEGVPSIKGVVFNEMKGGMSEENRLISRRFMKLLFPDSCYGFNSGGAPEAIPSLSYEGFVETYRRCYHPSNAYVFLDGDVPIEETLAALDAYFSRFEPLEVLPEIPLQEPRAAEESHFYEIAPGESMENKARLTMGKIIGTWRDKLSSTAAYVLCDVLAGSNEAPLKRAVLESGLAKNLLMTVDDSLYQHYFRLTARDVADGRADELRALIGRTAQELLETGLDPAAIHASINRLEFNLRDIDEPQGLMRCMSALSGWLHGGDPMEYMTFDADFAALRAMADDGSFHDILRKLLLDGKDMVVLHTLPSATLGEETRRAEERFLAETCDGWSEADRAANEELNRALTAWQQSADTPAQLATLPALPLSAVGMEPVCIPTQVHEIDGVTCLHHPIPSRGIVHFTAYFALTDLTTDEISALSLLYRLLGKLPTRRRSAAELEQMLKQSVGSMGFKLCFHARYDEPERCTPCLEASCSVLEHNLPLAQALMAEILTETIFDEPERIRKAVQQAEIASRQVPVSAGHAVALSAVLSRYSARGAAQEAHSGGTALRYLHDFAENFEERLPAFISLLERIRDVSVCRSRLTLSQTAPRFHSMDGLIGALPAGTPVAPSAAITLTLPEKIASPIPAQASFSSQGCHLSRIGVPYHGGFSVAASIVSLGYLWNAVRVQGGAYGAGMSIGLGGNIYTYSYRDPTPAASLDANLRARDFLEGFIGSGEAIDKYIISTIAKAEPLESPREQGESGDDDYFSGLTPQLQQRIRWEMLETDAAVLHKFCDVLQRFASEGAVCIVGHEDALKQRPGLETLSL